MKIITRIASALILLLLIGTGYAADVAKKPPIDITSDSLEATGSDIVFIGNVTAIYGETKIDADRMKVLYESKEEGSGEEGKQDIKTIIATGNVEVIEAKRHAWADKLVYERESGIATLTGNPRIKQVNNTVKGDLIKIFLDEDRVEIKGNVKAIVNPDTLKE